MEQRKIGQFIQNLRKEADLTQKELAGKIGVSDKTVSKWENGNGLPDLESLYALSAFFGVSINEVLAGERRDAEAYPQKTEEVIVDLMKKNHKLGILQGCTGILLCCMSVLFFFVQEYGLSFRLYLPSFLDVPSCIVLLMLCGACVCMSGAREKGTILLAISKTILPIGFFMTLAKSVKVLLEGAGRDAFMVSFSLCLLPLLYALVIYLFACVVRIRTHLSADGGSERRLPR